MLIFYSHRSWTQYWFCAYPNYHRVWFPQASCGWTIFIGTSPIRRHQAR